jgi:hypothetical protein
MKRGLGEGASAAVRSEEEESPGQKRDHPQKETGIVHMDCFVVCMHFISSLCPLFSLILTQCLLSLPGQMLFLATAETACVCLHWAHALNVTNIGLIQWGFTGVPFLFNAFNDVAHQ